MKKVVTAVSALMMATALTSLASTAQAADLAAKAPYYKAPVVEAWNPWMIRLRVLA
jgi:outer membrane protein